VIIKSNGNRNIEDYILRVDKIPLSCARNRDGTHIIGEFKMVVSENCPAADRAEGVDVEVYTSGSTYPSFTGEITKAQQNHNDKTYDLMVRDKMYKLEDKIVSRANLNTLLTAGTGIEYGADTCFASLMTVQVLYIIKIMFQDCGVSFFDIQTSALATTKVVDIIYEGTSRQIDFKHLRLDPDMFYAINQDIAGRTLIDDPKYDDKRISYFEFISDFCSHFDCQIYLSTSGTAKQYGIAKIANTGSLPVTDDDIYSYILRKQKAKGSGWNVSHKFSALRYNYFNDSGYSLDTEKTFKGGDGKESLSIKNNLLYLYSRWWEGIDARVIWNVSPFTCPDHYDANAYDDGFVYTAAQMIERQKRNNQVDLTILRRNIPLAQKYGDFRTNNVIISSTEQMMETVYEY